MKWMDGLIYKETKSTRRETGSLFDIIFNQAKNI
jgi:hypothetical protein